MKKNYDTITKNEQHKTQIPFVTLHQEAQRVGNFCTDV